MAIPIDDDFPLDGNNWEDLDDNEQCIVCFEHLPDTVFIECGHRYFEFEPTVPKNNANLNRKISLVEMEIGANRESPCSESSIPVFYHCAE